MLADRDAALEQVRQDQQPFDEDAAETVDLLDSEQIIGTEVVEGGLQPGALVDAECARDFLLEHFDANRVERVALALRLLFVGAHAHQSDERHGDLRSEKAFILCSRWY